MSLFSKKIAYDFEPGEIGYIIEKSLKVRYDYNKVLDICNTLGTDNVIKSILSMRLNSYISIAIELMEFLIIRNKFFELNLEIIKMLPKNNIDLVFKYKKKFGVDVILDKDSYNDILKVLCSVKLPYCIVDIIKNNKIEYFIDLLDSNPENFIRFMTHNEEMYHLVMSNITIKKENLKDIIKYYNRHNYPDEGLRFILNPNYLYKYDYINYLIKVDDRETLIRSMCYTTPLPIAYNDEYNQPIYLLRYSYRNLRGFRVYSASESASIIDYKLPEHVAYQYPRAFMKLYNLVTEQDVRVLVWKNGFKLMFVHNQNFRTMYKMGLFANNNFYGIKNGITDGIKNELTEEDINGIYDRREGLKIDNYWDFVDINERHDMNYFAYQTLRINQYHQVYNNYNNNSRNDFDHGFDNYNEYTEKFDKDFTV